MIDTGETHINITGTCVNTCEICLNTSGTCTNTSGTCINTSGTFGSINYSTGLDFLKDKHFTDYEEAIYPFQ